MTGFALVAQDIVAVLLVVAGLGKLAAADRFREAVGDYQLLPAPLVPAVARVLPLAEIAFGVLLVSGVARPVGLVGAAVLLTAFAAAMATNVVRGRRIDCGCGGSRQARVISWWLVLRNVSLVGLLIFAGIAIGAVPSLSVTTWPPALLSALALVMAISAGRAAVGILRHPVVTAYRAAVRS